MYYYYHRDNPFIAIITLIKAHGSKSCGQENSPHDKLPRVFYTHKNKKQIIKLTFPQLKLLPYCCCPTTAMSLFSKQKIYNGVHAGNTKI